jgi:TolB-like protein
MSRNAAFRYKGRQVDAEVVGRNLNVDAVIAGRIARQEELLSISLEIIDARDNSHIWGVQHVRPYSDVFTMPTKIAEELTEKLRLKLTTEEQRRLSKHHEKLLGY